MSRKILITLITFLIFAIVFFLFFFYFPSQYKNNVKVNYYHLNAFDKEDEQAKILVFSDTNLGEDYNIEDLNKLVETINNQEADIVIFNGDLLSKDNKLDAKQKTKVIEVLLKIKPLYGKFATLGENDDKSTIRLLENADFEILNNARRNVRVNDISFNIIGLYNNENYKKPLKNLSDKSFNFAIVSNPALIDSLLANKIDVIVSGYTLGGQYNIPFFGSIYQDLQEGAYSKGNIEENGIKIYNSNGIGTKYNNMRLLAPSSIEVFILN